MQAAQGRRDCSSFGNIPDIPAPSASLVAAAVVGASALYLAKRGEMMTDAGVTYVVQNNLTGQINLKKKKIPRRAVHRHVPLE